MFETRLPWVSMTPLGIPVVPEEKGSVATSSKNRKSGMSSGYLLPSSQIILSNDKLVSDSLIGHPKSRETILICAEIERFGE